MATKNKKPIHKKPIQRGFPAKKKSIQRGFPAKPAQRPASRENHAGSISSSRENHAGSVSYSSAIPFKKILIANRGEIACRVMRTCKRLGIATVAVYSDADAEALHVREADEAVRIGPPPSAQSYLRIEAIVTACRQTGAEAVHPGYGFLSENAAFAEALEKAGIVFIGPTMSAVAAMGDKIESKKLAQKAGVTMVPGHLAAIADAEEAVAIAHKVGYPVMIKASAGGGGKGMRIAHNDAEARDGFRSATSEANSSFGDDRVFIEKYIEEPRHIEIQVLGDAHGNVIHLGERECSIQRRHQKVIEEAPSPFLDAKTRAAMGAQAVALAKAVDYRSAGTVEFIVDRKRNFYFLEMNTRLQVEHPVTEIVTGLDLVEWMIRVAAGERLPFKQADIRLDGWAVEARVYAEDPFRNFLPSIGRLTRYRPPAAEGIRVDSGAYDGGEISMYYDPMIAKLIGSGASREEACDRLAAALDAYVVRGLNHNIPFLQALIRHPRFREGRLSTGFIAEEFRGGFKGAFLSAETRARLAIVAATVQLRIHQREAAIGDQLAGHERVVPSGYVVGLDIEGAEPTTIKLSPGVAIDPSGRAIAVDSDWRVGGVLFRGTVDGVAMTVQVEVSGTGMRLSHAGASVRASVLSPRVAELSKLMPVKRPPDTSRFLLSPMPGLLKAIAVKLGQEVKAGEELCIVEAMKMENILRAERDGVVGKLHAAVGDSLAVDQKILEFG
ncbi:MAG: acetyl/propionyl/methylcrotonyl-CoA carboxylase subunit alpha [Alphaproteobacteria bacterium]|nr:acetyl/propionyl/methylcrotonyl-CoA carboxylase subunit alpha [Alphaproteobacteria bacterium]